MKKDNIIYSKEDKIEQNGNSESLLRYFNNWPWFLLIGGLGLLIGLLIYKITPPSYRVESKILIKGESNPLQSNIMLDNFLGVNASSNMANQIEMLQSYTNYKRALENLDWKTTWFKKDQPFDIELYSNPPAEVVIPLSSKNLFNQILDISIIDNQSYQVRSEIKEVVNGKKQSIEISQQGKFGEKFRNDYFTFILYKSKNFRTGDFYFRFNNINLMAQKYLEKVNVEIPNLNSEVIKMQVSGTIARKEADFLNELNNVFIQLGIEEEERSSEHSVNFINEQLLKIKDSLDRSEQNFSNYRRQNQVVDLSQEASFIYQKLEEVETERYEASMRLDYYQNLLNYIDDSEGLEQISAPSVVGIEDNNLSNTLQKLTEFYNRREILSYTVKEQSPSYILLEKEISLLRNSLYENLNNLISNTKSEITSIDKRHQEIQGRLKQLPETEKELIGIQRDFEHNNTMYNYMLKKKAEAELSKASTAPKVQIIDKALPESAVQIGPSMPINLALGLGLGLFFPFIIIFFSEIFSSNVKSKEEVEMLSNIRVLDGIIYSKGKHKLPVLENPRSGLSESFRGLRYNIRNLYQNNQSIIISINSMMPGEGKTFISSNLAAVFAMSDKKVLLVGADIRKPRLEKIFGSDDGVGLSSYLMGKSSFNEVIKDTETPKLAFVPSGKVPDNPTELLENGRIKDFLLEAKKTFDFIVIDNAPVSLVADGKITSSFSDLNLFAVRINKTQRKNIQEINKIVDLNNISNSAIVMNCISPKGYTKGYVKKGYGHYS